MRSYICGDTAEAPPPGTSSILNMRSRNAQQDVALATMAPKEELQKLFGACDAPPV